MIRMGRYAPPIICGVMILMTGCAAFYDPQKQADIFLENYAIAAPQSPLRFSTCYHYGCNGGGASITLSQRQWHAIEQQFFPQPADAAAEREQIAAAIALLETFAGRQNNTFADQACNNFRDPIESFQHDCVAETVNTTVYLMLLQQNRLLTKHSVAYPAHRSVALVLQPHYSAVIRETASGALFAVDSWFHANGERPEIVPIGDWRNHFSPGPCS